MAGAIVFASDRSGNYDLWKLVVNGDGTAGALTQLTRTPQQETSPSVAGDGRIAFLRGSGNATRVWVMDAAGKEARVTTGGDTERSPQFAPKGSYPGLPHGDRERPTARGHEHEPAAMARRRAAARRSTPRRSFVSWSWDGERLAISTRTGTFLVPRAGGYTNFLATANGQTAWSPDGKTIAIASFEETNVAYNGDPDRGTDRSAVLRTPDARGSERLTFASAPIAPNVTVEPRLAGGESRADRNAAAFDRVWDRSTRLYFSQADAAARRAQWETHPEVVASSRRCRGDATARWRP